MSVPGTRAIGWSHLHRFDLTLATYYGPKVRNALRDGITHIGPAVRGVAANLAGQFTPHHRIAHAHVVKGNGDAAQQAAAAAAQQLVAEYLLVDLDGLLHVLADIYGDGYLAGARAAVDAAIEAGMAGAVVGSGFGAVDAAIDWAAWSPGHAEAALLAAGTDGAGSGLAVLLGNAGVTINGIENATLNQIGGIIARGLRDGTPPSGLVSAVERLVDDPIRADMIALTETSRALNVAAVNTYAANGIGWDWLTTAGACTECDDKNASGPYGPGDDAPPLHPRCRCSASPDVSGILADLGGDMPMGLAISDS